MALSRPIYIVAAKRTAFGAFGGKLKGLLATILGEKAAVAALDAGKVDPAIVDHVIFGNVIQVHVDYWCLKYIQLYSNKSLESVLVCLIAFFSNFLRRITAYLRHA